MRNNVLTGIFIFFSLVALVALGWMFWFLRTVFLYMIIAAVLTVMTRPLGNLIDKIRFRKKKVPRGIRSFLILISIYLVLFGFVSIFIPLITNEANILSNVSSKQLSQALHEPIRQVQDVFASYQQSSGDTQSLDQSIQKVTGEMLNAAQVSSIANTVASILGNAIVALLAISFFTFFFVKDGPVIFETLLLLVPPKHIQAIRNISDNSQVMLSKYFTGVLLDIVFVTTFVSSGLAILGVPNPLIIGFFAGIMNIIPYVGPLIGGAFAVVIGISANLDLDFYNGLLPLAEKIILVFVLMNVTDAFLVQPFIFSKRVKAHPLEIFTVVLMAGKIAGIGGMVVAVPTYTILRIVAREFFSKYRFVQRITNDLEKSTAKKTGI